jgi:hypothetical protein
MAKHYYRVNSRGYGATPAEISGYGLEENTKAIKYAGLHGEQYSTSGNDDPTIEESASDRGSIISGVFARH